jgi:hypothetical protein
MMRDGEEGFEQAEKGVSSPRFRRVGFLGFAADDVEVDRSYARRSRSSQIRSIAGG